MKFYKKSEKEIINEWNLDLNKGLTNDQVLKSRDTHGENKLPEEKEDSYLKVFIKSFKEPIVIVLMGAVLMSFASSFYATYVQLDVKHGREAMYEAIAILTLIIINAFLGFWQEISARKSLNALKEMNNRQTTVLRNGVWEKIISTDLVTGDIIKVAVGDFVEADVRWIESNELQVIESHLTGEADAIAKITGAIEEETEIGDQKNMGFSGSIVANGSGVGVVVGVGTKTELGKIAELLQSVEQKKSPLQKTISQLTKVLMIISGSIVVFTFVVGIFQAGEFSISSLTSVLSTSIALAVASIPDALPAVLSIVLTIGATKMAKNRGLIKSLTSVETLGGTSYICSDKTGTLTKNEMTVVKFLDNGYEFDVTGLGYEPKGSIIAKNKQSESHFIDSLFLKGAILCNEAEVREDEGKWLPIGNPTEVALTVLGRKANLVKNNLLNDHTIVRTLPFTSARKMMSVIVCSEGRYFLFTKGAPDVLTENSSAILIDNNLDKTLAAKVNFIHRVEDFADEALRTLAVAYREISEDEALNETVENLEKKLIITGVAGIIDPAREEVKHSIKILHEANIEVVMITGDHVKTAKAIAYDLGIIKSKKAKSLTGKELENMTDEELYQVAKEIKVYARVSPEHKQRIVKQLQKHGEIVAMTGDGVNDSPALRVADIGIAMGIAGTEVTKDSADLILLDDKFTTIEKSVHSGRTIYANIKNFIRHELTTNVAEVLSLIVGLLFFTKTVGNVEANTPTLTALMVLWVNMVSDAIPSFSLGYDVPESDIMKEHPRDPKKSILADYTWSRVLIRGTVMGLLVYVAFVWAANQGMTSNQAQTVAFLTLVYGQLWHVFDARSSKTLFRRNPFGNSKLILAVLFAGITSYLVTVIPFFNEVMGTASLDIQTYLLVLFIPSIPTFLLSGFKELFKVKIW